MELDLISAWTSSLTKNAIEHIKDHKLKNKGISLNPVSAYCNVLHSGLNYVNKGQKHSTCLTLNKVFTRIIIITIIKITLIIIINLKQTLKELTDWIRMDSLSYVTVNVHMNQSHTRTNDKFLNSPNNKAL